MTTRPANPSVCRIVRYHFKGLNDDHQVEYRWRPAMVTSIGADDQTVNLFVFFEPNDFELMDETPSFERMYRFAVKPLDSDTNTFQGDRWSWPPRV